MVNEVKHIQNNLPGWLLQPGFAIGSHTGFKNGRFGAGNCGLISTCNLYHEVGHAFELYFHAPSKLDYRNLNLSVPSRPKRPDMFLRELRTVAIQMRLCEQDTACDFDKQSFLEYWPKFYRMLPDANAYRSHCMRLSVEPEAYAIDYLTTYYQNLKNVTWGLFWPDILKKIHGTMK